MKIPLPSKFIYYTNDRTASAYVRKNTLYINGLISWEKLAYDLCYALNGRKVCTYCGKTIKKSKMTLDHMFPRFFGGVSIPTNLTPACKSCNNKKSDLNYYEFKVFRTMNEKDGKRYRMSIYRKKERLDFKEVLIFQGIGQLRWILKISSQDQSQMMVETRRSTKELLTLLRGMVICQIQLLFLQMMCYLKETLFIGLLLISVLSMSKL